MKIFLGALLYMFSLTAFSEDQASCAERFNTQIREIGTVATGYAEQATYKTIFEDAKQCIDQGKCSKPEALLSISEMKVDGKIVDIQRQKISALKTFLVEARQQQSDVCALSKKLPSVSRRIERLNAKQIERFTQLSERQFSTASR